MYRSKVPICKKNLPHFWLYPRIGKFIEKFQWIYVPYIIVRSSLALDAPNDYDTLDLGWGAEAIRWSQMAMWREILQELWYYVRIYLRARFTKIIEINTSTTIDQKWIWSITYSMSSYNALFSMYKHTRISCI